LIFAGNISNALESVGLVHLTNPLPQPLKLRAMPKKGLKCNSTGLEVWGTNLRSTVGESFTRNELAMVRFPSHIKEIIIGLILSDGSLNLSKNSKNAQLRFKQSIIHSEYFWFVFNFLSHYCPSNPKLYTGVRKGTRLYELLFYTRSMPCFTELHSLFYVNGVKIIPENIFELLTPAALAHLIMGDGQ
jgi:hypothetical protein